jgi:regulatory protein
VHRTSLRRWQPKRRSERIPTSPWAVAMASNADVKRALSRAYGLLSIRARSTQEIRRSLHRSGFDDATVEQVVVDLQRQGLLDDQAFADDWTHSRTESKPRSRRLVERELCEKGVSREDAARATAAIDDESTALTLAAKRARVLRDLDRETFIRRLSRYLLARGFSRETVHHAIDAVLPDRDDS